MTSQKTKALLLEKYAAGKSLPDLSMEFGLSEATIRFHLVKNGATMRSSAEGARLARLKLRASKRRARIINDESYQAEDRDG